MASFFFGVSLVMALALWATGNPWYILPQWTAIIFGLTITVFEFLDERRRHEEFMKRYERK